MDSGPSGAMERLALSVSSLPALSRAVGRLADLRLPGFLLRPVLRLYVRAYGVDLEEAADPVHSFRTFNAFFTRRLRAGARPIDGDAVVVSPSDSRLRAISPVPADGRLEQIKGSTYSIEALLGSAEDAAPFLGGVHATLYLSPSMYHRVHSPVDGRIGACRHVPGRRFPVNAAGVRSVPGLFVRNERVALLLDTEAHGPVAVVLVGAANVGRITLAPSGLEADPRRSAGRVVPAKPLPVRRGDELGAFNLGSTVVLLVADPALVPTAAAGDVVRVGQALWRRD